MTAPAGGTAHRWGRNRTAPGGQGPPRRIRRPEQSSGSCRSRPHVPDRARRIAGPGRRVGLGQSVSALSLLGLLPKKVSRITQGSAVFEGKNLIGLADEEMRKIRGARIAMIFQDPLASLNPVLTIGRQITEALETHKHMGRTAANKRAADLLTMVGIPGRHPAHRRLPPPVLGRHAPARHDRDGAVLRAGAADRGRADDGTGRDDPGADPGALQVPSPARTPRLGLSWLTRAASLSVSGASPWRSRSNL